MSQAKQTSISVALENLALALGDAGAVPRGDLVRALERAAERLRGRSEHKIPNDLVPQAQAARIVGVTRQAVNQWVRNGAIHSYYGTESNGRSPVVSVGEVVVVANRWRTEPLSATLKRDLIEFLDALVDPSFTAIAQQVARSLEKDWISQQPDDAARVLREFLEAAMGAAGRQQEFTRAGVQMLAELPPDITVDTEGAFGQLADSLGLLIHSRDGRSGFDSASAAILGLVGCATVGVGLQTPAAAIRQDIARAAGDIWGEEWVRRLLDSAFQIGEVVAAPLTRYTAPLVYLGCNRFMRQAQASGVSITYARSPAGMLAESYDGGAVLSKVQAERSRSPEAWDFDDISAGSGAGPNRLARSPFRKFNFQYGLFDDSIHGVRRYCFSTTSARKDLQSAISRLPKSQTAAYIEHAIKTLSNVLQKPYVEMCCLEPPADFDWWKDHVIRSSADETVIGLRGERARSTAHALVVHTSVLPQVIEAGAEDASLRERLRLYVKNLDFALIDERYRDDLKRGATRLIKSASLELSADEADVLAAAEIDELLAH